MLLTLNVRRLEIFKVKIDRVIMILCFRGWGFIKYENVVKKTCISLKYFNLTTTLDKDK